MALVTKVTLLWMTSQLLQDFALVRGFMLFPLDSYNITFMTLFTVNQVKFAWEKVCEIDFYVAYSLCYKLINCSLLHYIKKLL